MLIVGEEFPPFKFEENNKIVGIDVEVARHIFDRMGVEGFIPLKNSLCQILRIMIFCFFLNLIPQFFQKNLTSKAINILLFRPYQRLITMNL